MLHSSGTYESTAGLTGCKPSISMASPVSATISISAVRLFSEASIPISVHLVSGETSLSFSSKGFWAGMAIFIILSPPRNCAMASILPTECFSDALRSLLIMTGALGSSLRIHICDPVASMVIPSLILPVWNPSVSSPHSSHGLPSDFSFSQSLTGRVIKLSPSVETTATVDISAAPDASHRPRISKTPRERSSVKRPDFNAGGMSAPVSERVIPSS